VADGIVMRRSLDRRLSLLIAFPPICRRYYPFSRKQAAGTSIKVQSNTSRTVNEREQPFARPSWMRRAARPLIACASAGPS
jgi:hypothetical protein